MSERVTHILREMGLSPSFAGIDPAILEHARQRGEAVHKACEVIDRGEPERPWLKHEEAAPYVIAYRHFRAESGYQVEATEEQVEHVALGYRGRLDMRGQLHGVRTVIDRKATAQVPASTAIQCAAYALALPVPCTAIAALHLRRDGTYRLIQYDFDESRRVWLAALEVFRWQQRRLETWEMRKLGVWINESQ